MGQIINHTFNWKSLPVEIPPLKQVNTNQGRYYTKSDTDLKFYSVTTILGDDPKKQEGLNEWRKRVGQKEANKISKYSANRGTKLHNLFEQYLSNEDIGNEDTILPHIKQLFLQGKRIFPKKITSIYALEQKLYSPTLQLAGQVDGIIEWENVPYIIDFKTSGKEKKKEWIEDYFLQCTAYSIMLKEITGLDISNILVFITIEGQNKPQMFFETVNNYKPILLKRLYQFYQRRNLKLPPIFQNHL